MWGCSSQQCAPDTCTFKSTHVRPGNPTLFMPWHLLFCPQVVLSSDRSLFITCVIEHQVPWEVSSSPLVAEASWVQPHIPLGTLCFFPPTFLHCTFQLWPSFHSSVVTLSALCLPLSYNLRPWYALKLTSQTALGTWGILGGPREVMHMCMVQ